MRFFLNWDKGIRKGRLLSSGACRLLTNHFHAILRLFLCLCPPQGPDVMDAVEGKGQKQHGRTDADQEPGYPLRDIVPEQVQDHHGVKQPGGDLSPP